MVRIEKRLQKIEALLVPKELVVIDPAMFDAALGRISAEHRASFKSSFEAEIAGRTFTDCESAARTAFDYICRQEYRPAAKDPVTEFERLYGTRANDSSGPLPT